MIAIKFVAFVAFVASAAHSGDLGYAAAPALAYSSAPSVSYSSVSAPYAHQTYAAPAVQYAHSAPAVQYAHSAPALQYAHSAPVAYAAPIHKTIVAEQYAPPHYDFGYSVNDPHTGDSKSQQETRRGDVVQGSYSLVEADGTKRIVEYTADAHNGFNAVVHKEGVAVKAVAPVVKAVSYAAPALAHGYAAPAYAQSYATPALSHGYAAPALAQTYATPGLSAYASPAVSYASHGAPAYYHH